MQGVLINILVVLNTLQYKTARQPKGSKGGGGLFGGRIDFQRGAAVCVSMDIQHIYHVLQDFRMLLRGKIQHLSAETTMDPRVTFEQT